MNKMSYEEAKMLCEKAQEKSSLASSILKKYREKYGDDEFLKGLPPLFVRESQNYKQHVMESDKAFKELQSINTWFMKNFKKEYKKEMSHPDYRMNKQKEIRLQKEKIENLLKDIEVSIWEDEKFMYYNSIILKENESIKDMFVNSQYYAVVVYNSNENLYYAIMDGNRSKPYKTRGRCKNLITRNDYHSYLSENDTMNIRKRIMYK